MVKLLVKLRKGWNMKIELKDYEKYFEELNEIVEKLDSSDVKLDEAIILHKKGLEIYKALKDILDEEELSLKEYSEKEGFNG